ncbi:MAG: hypothetical protein A2X86_01505 [Bdellovibrionales bacterium GWA2_49_15]|nr:MAG: hypothetical protein A2X86_01505 [Bdellovibrionales bacterium GWA2_49_15]
MKKLIQLAILVMVPFLVFGGDKKPKELCAVGLSECGENLKCIPSLFDQNSYGKFSKQGLCLAPRAKQETCGQRSLAQSCATGLTCVSPTMDAAARLVGTCQHLERLSLEQMISSGIIAKPTSSNPVKKCKYLPGNYYHSNGRDDADCCGLTRQISNPSAPGKNIVDIKYCDWVPVGDSKQVTSPSFCGKTQNGDSLEWKGVMIEGAPAGEPVYGTCQMPTPRDPRVVLSEDPEFTFDQVQCLPIFKPDDLESRVGLMSDWEGVGDMRYWFTSLPTQNFYRVGDEPFIMAYIWLFKNTDQDSLTGTNFKARDLAKKLYDMFALHYSKGFQDGFELMKELDKIKNCILIQGPLAFQLRYQMSLIMEQALLGTIRAYQCGGVENLDPSNFNCKQEENAFFAKDFANITSSAEEEFARCADPFINGCQKNYYLYDWDDNQRNDFIVNTVKAATGQDLWLYKATPFFDDMAMDTLIDPPVNTSWIPLKFKDDFKTLLKDLNAANPNVQIVMPTEGGRDPNFHWQIILRPEILSEVFPEKPPYEGKSFLHYHEKMPYITEASKVYQNTLRINPGATEGEYWNGPLTIASEGVRIMEHYSCSDEPMPLNIRGADLQAHLRQLHFAYHRDVVPQRLARLIQYYVKKLESIKLEQECLVEKIKQLSKIAGIDTTAADYDPAVITLDMSRHSCPGTGGGDGNGDGKDRAGANLLTGKSVTLPGQIGTSAGAHSVISNNRNGNVGFVDPGLQVAPISESTMLGSNKTQSISLASLVKNKATFNVNGRDGAMASAKLGLKKQKDASLLKYKKATENGQTDPEMINDDSLNKIARQVFKKNSLASPVSMSNLNNENVSHAPATPEEVAAKLNVAIGGRPAEKQLGVMPEEKIKIGGGVQTKSIVANSAAVSYTGLSSEHEEEILNNIAKEDLAENENDSLFRKVTKAYIKNYKKLFSSKTR